MNPQETSSSESLSGTIERVTFHNAETGFSVLKVKSRGRRDLVVLTGVCPSAQVGEEVEATGKWEIHREFGEQFQAREIKSVPPTSLLGIEKYLGSGLVRGIGPHFAKRIVEHFKEKTLTILDDTPEKLLTVGGIGQKRLNLIIESWNIQKTVRGIMVFLQGYGISTNKALRIFKTYGENAVAILKDNPYRLARDIYGIGFKSADDIALKMGLPSDSPQRVRAAFHYQLQKACSEGHMAYPADKLIEEVSEMLSIDKAQSEKCLHAEIFESDLIQDTIESTRVVFLKPLFFAEKEVAARLVEIKDLKPGWGPIDVEKAIPWVEQRVQITLADKQKEALSLCAQHSLVIITGGPGTGKTTLTRALIEILKAKKLSFHLASPTGRAAKRLEECTGESAQTLHRLLKFNPREGGFSFHASEPLATQLLLIDESSMMDIHLFLGVLRALPKTASLVLIGDMDQLPSVGPGKILRDLIESKKVATVQLDHIFRQAGSSQIIQAAHKINHSEFPQLEQPKESDFFFIEKKTPEEGLPLIKQLVAKSIPERFGLSATQDIQVLAPMQRGVLGARNLNVELQKLLNPHPSLFVERFGYRFGVGDKVMVVQNDYEKDVFNGDVGFISKLDLEEATCEILFEERAVEFAFDELDIVVPAYAITVHKAQGSEYPAVVIPVFTQHYMMLKKNLLYTAVTRGKRLVVVVGQKNALGLCLKNERSDIRWTKLKDYL